MATYLTKNFTLEELCASNKAKEFRIDNEPRSIQVGVALTALANNVLQPVRDYLKKPLRISSGYRCTKLNAAVDGSINSQHLEGQAADIDCHNDRQELRLIFDYIRENLDYDQLLFEHNKSGDYWIHVSYRADGKNRRQWIDNYEKK